jgi:N-acetylglutamate synthase-like GNAT family acetyltransferase
MKANMRQATPGDAPALADLVTQLGYPSRAEQVAARLTTLLTAEQGLLVAEIGEVVVGVVHVHLMNALQLDNAAEIGALAVDSEWRSQGIGRALLQAAEKWATQRGCSTLYVRSNIVRQRAHKFYRQNGFHQVKTSLTFVKEL